MNAHAPVQGKPLLDADGLARTLSRIAHEIIEGNPELGDLALVGIQTRGVPLARRLARLIEERAGVEPALGAVDITFYRDDVTVRGGEAPLEALFDYGRPARVQLAVLVDRGHRELPIRPDYVGKNLPTARGERIQVQLVEVDELDAVLLVSTPEEESR